MDVRLILSANTPDLVKVLLGGTRAGEIFMALTLPAWMTHICLAHVSLFAMQKSDAMSAGTDIIATFPLSHEGSNEAAKVHRIHRRNGGCMVVPRERAQQPPMR